MIYRDVTNGQGADYRSAGSNVRFALRRRFSSFFSPMPITTYKFQRRSFHVHKIFGRDGREEEKPIGLLLLLLLLLPSSEGKNKRKTRWKRKKKRGL